MLNNDNDNYSASLNYFFKILLTLLLIRNDDTAENFDIKILSHVEVSIKHFLSYDSSSWLLILSVSAEVPSKINIHISVEELSLLKITDCLLLRAI